SATEDPSPVRSPAFAPRLHVLCTVNAPIAPTGRPNNRPIKIPRNRYSIFLLLIAGKGRPCGLPSICLCAIADGICLLLCLHGSGSFFDITDDLAHCRNCDPAAVKRVFDADNRRS